MSKYNKINCLKQTSFIYFVFRRLEWNAYQIQLENQIAEDHKALSRKEQYIKHQEYMIENLTQENLNLEIQLNKPVIELQSHQSEEIENYQNEIKRLSTIIADTKKTLVANKESHMTEISEMRYLHIYITLKIVILISE